MTRIVWEDAQLQSTAVHLAVVPMNIDSPKNIRPVGCREQEEKGKPHKVIQLRSQLNVYGVYSRENLLHVSFCTLLEIYLNCVR